MDARQSDLLDLHTNVARRVRNLETGVHPLRSDADYADSIPPTIFPETGGSSDVSPVGTTSSTEHPRYQKRSGIAALIGMVNVDPEATGALYGTLPEAMWPTLDQAMLAGANIAPYVARVQVTSSGLVRFTALGFATAGMVYLDGLTWATA